MSHWFEQMKAVEGKRYRSETYVFGLGVLVHHILIAPFDTDVIEQFHERPSGYSLNKKTIKVPVDSDVDVDLVRDLVKALSAS
jgi:uncharacterized protein YdhG (YjbR/CyaY superfamily)